MSESHRDSLVHVRVGDDGKVFSQVFKVQEKWLHLLLCVRLKETDVT